MSAKTFVGPSRWEDFEAWRALLPGEHTIMSIGSWPDSEGGSLVLYIEYGIQETIVPPPETCPQCHQRIRRKKTKA